VALAAQAGLAQALARRLGLEQLPQIEELDDLGEGALVPLAQPPLRSGGDGSGLGAQPFALGGHLLHPRCQLVALQQRAGQRQHRREGGQRDEDRHQGSRLEKRCQKRDHAAPKLPPKNRN
jgi:hypothetical protein